MKQNIVSKIINEEERVKRESHGRTIAISRCVYRLAKTDVYYVQSSTVPSRYYYVRFQYEPNLHSNDNNSSSWCSCMDYYSNRSEKCKHQYAVEYSIRLGTLQDTDNKLPISHNKRDKKTTTIAEQYKDYSIATLNELEKAEIEAEAYRTKRQSWELDDYSF